MRLPDIVLFSMECMQQFLVIAQTESQTLVIRDACFWKCFDTRTLTAMTLEFILLFLVRFSAMDPFWSNGALGFLSPQNHYGS